MLCKKGIRIMKKYLFVLVIIILLPVLVSCEKNGDERINNDTDLFLYNFFHANIITDEGIKKKKRRRKLQMVISKMIKKKILIIKK